MRDMRIEKDLRINMRIKKVAFRWEPLAIWLLDKQIPRICRKNPVFAGLALF
jgi:hypothetical protein